MAGGRPTKYTPELLDKAYEYLDSWKDDEGAMIPTHVGLALRLDVNQDTLYTWAKEKGKEEFSEILATCKAKQRFELLNNGLSGLFSAPITKLVLGKHGFNEKNDNQDDDDTVTKVVIEKVDAS